MKLNYKPAVFKGNNHYLEINGEAITTTKQKEIILFARSRITGRFEWKEFKEAVRLQQPITIN